MADSKIADLTEATTLAGSDIVYVVVNPDGTPVDHKVQVGVAATAGAASATYAQRVAALGAAHFWKLDETSGTAAADSRGGTSADGTYVGTPTLNQTGIDPEGTVCVDFDGTDDGITLPFNANSLGVSSWAMWIEPDDVTTEQILFEFGGTTAGIGAGIYNGSIWSYFFTSSSYRARASATISADTVYLASFVIDPSSAIASVFLDGALADIDSDSAWSGVSGSNAGGLFINNSDHKGPNSTSASPYNGKASGVAHFGRPLADWEHRYLFGS